MQTKEELLKEVEKLFEGNKYQEIVGLLNDETLELHNDAEVYAWKGRMCNIEDDYENGLNYCNISISKNPNIAFAYYVRGNCWSGKEEYDKALADLTKAVELEEFADAYHNRAVIFQNMGDHYKAISDYSEAIKLEKEYWQSYYNRGNIYKELRQYKEAIDDYFSFLDSYNNKNDFWAKKARANIKELKKKITSILYDDVSNIVAKIKELLVFDGNCITHYTALSTARILIINDNSRLRLSEGTFLNDTSEGRVLFKELNFHITKKENREDKSESEPFTEKPFIGSFVAEAKHDDLTLWRMYGKENNEEARGCALTLHRETFINSALDSIKENGNDNEISLDNQFTFYNVAYISKNNSDGFVIPNNKEIEQKLNELMVELKNKLRGRKSRNLKLNIAEKLNEIVYLFKDAEYQYENEVRLIVSGIGFPKEINFEKNMGVYIYLADIRPALHKITLGPKVERVEELAAAFNYHLKENYEDKNVEIIMSHLPFK